MAASLKDEFERRFAFVGGRGNQDHLFIQLLYELAHGVTLNDDTYTLHNEESYHTIIEALKEFRKTEKNHLKKYSSSRSARLLTLKSSADLLKSSPTKNEEDIVDPEFLTLMIDFMAQSDFSSYKFVFHTMLNLGQIFDALLLSKAYHMYGIPSHGYRYFSKSDNSLTNIRPHVLTKQDKTQEISGAVAKPVQYISRAMHYMDKYFETREDQERSSIVRHTSMTVEKFDEMTARGDLNIYGEEEIRALNSNKYNPYLKNGLKFFEEDLVELERRIQISLQSRMKTINAHASDNDDTVRFIDYIRKSTPQSNETREEMKKVSSSGLLGGFMSSRLFGSGGSRLNVLWGVPEACKHPGCQGNCLRRSWVRNVSFHVTYCADCMRPFLLKEQNKLMQNGSTNLKLFGTKYVDLKQNLNIYNVEGCDAIYQFVMNGHLKNESTLGDADREAIVLEFDNILFQAAEAFYGKPEKQKPKIFEKLVRPKNKILDQAFGVQFCSCKLCGKRFKKKADLVHHTRKNHPPKQQLSFANVAQNALANRDTLEEEHVADHDWRKRLVVIDHFAGKPGSGDIHLGDVVRVINTDNLMPDIEDGMEGILLSKIDPTDTDEREGFLVRFDHAMDGVFFEEYQIEGHHLNVLSTINTLFKHFREEMETIRLVDQENQSKIVNAYIISKRDFCTRLTEGLTMIHKLDWSHSSHKVYLNFLSETLLEIESIYMNKPLSEEMHVELMNRTSERVTVHGMTLLGQLLVDKYPDKTGLQKAVQLADVDNDGALSAKDMILSAGRPLLEQYLHTDKVMAKSKSRGPMDAGGKGIFRPLGKIEDTEVGETHTTKDQEIGYPDFPQTQAMLVKRIRRQKGTYSPCSEMHLIASLKDAEGFSEKLREVISLEERVEGMVLDFERRYDINAKMSAGERKTRKSGLNEKCKRLGIKYGWCHPKYWEWEHGLELYTQMALREVDLERAVFQARSSSDKS
jgi:hypothetical protein